jgi:uncharacterized protein YndB with AHSA1/START domain
VDPNATATRNEHWDGRTGGSWRYVSVHDGREYGFHGCFHEVRPGRIVQTVTFEGNPDGVALEMLWFEDLSDAMLRSGMEVGVDEGYARLQRMLIDGAV